MSDETLTPELAVAQLVVHFGIDDIDGPALAAAKALIKDQLAIQVGAAGLPWSRQMRHARQLRPGRSTIVADGEMVAAADAAYVNATYGHGFEYDDFAGNAHPGCCVVPVALAVGEEVGASMAQMLVALVAGYEAYVRIGYLGSPDLLNAGWQPHAVLSNFGAAATAAKLYRLDEERTLHALAIALSHASGPTEYTSTGGSIKRLHAGIGARNGIESADLARAGITGPRRFLTGNRGLYRTFIRKEVGTEAAKTFLRSEPLKISGLSFKPYCCCAATHAYIDAMATIRDKAARIEAIDTRIQTMTDAIVGNRNAHIYQPRNIEELQYSLPVQMALSALGIGNGYKPHRDYLEGRLSLAPDSEVIRLARRIKLEIDTRLDAKFPRNFVADVTVKYRDGTSETIFLGGAKGMPFNPLTLAEHKVKLDELTDDVLGQAKADALFGMVEEMRADRPVGDLTALLRRS